jgi:hypothetical protein
MKEEILISRKLPKFQKGLWLRNTNKSYFYY